jgi:hypothetical protein
MYDETSFAALNDWVTSRWTTEKCPTPPEEYTVGSNLSLSCLKLEGE